MIYCVTYRISLAGRQMQDIDWVPDTGRVSNIELLALILKSEITGKSSEDTFDTVLNTSWMVTGKCMLNTMRSRFSLM